MQLRTTIDLLADDIGRLRRHAQQLGYLADRLAEQAETLHFLASPSAAELAKWTAPGDDAAVDEAIRIVDERSRKLRGRLGGNT